MSRPPVRLVVAGLTPLCVLAVCMDATRVASLFWVFAGAGFFWVCIRFFLIAADHLTRYSCAPA